jgi:hypothetical protein
MEQDTEQFVVDYEFDAVWGLSTTPKVCEMCQAINLNPPAENEFLLTPALGGGWTAWRAALVRLFERIAGQPTQAIVVSQPGWNHRYVQTQIGAGVGLAQASSNVYLTGRSRLSDRKERQLIDLGWLEPHSDEHVENCYPANWGLPLIHGQWDRLGDLFLATMTTVFAFREDRPVRIHTYVCEHPCARCSWEDKDVLPPHWTRPRSSPLFSN